MRHHPLPVPRPGRGALLLETLSRGLWLPAILLVALVALPAGRPLAAQTGSEVPRAALTDEERFELVNVGWQLYQRYCKSCHGDKGHGDGSVAKFLTIPVADLTQIARRRGGAFPEAELRRILDGREEVRAHGRREMPVWGDVFDDPDEAAESGTTLNQKLDALIEFLRSINPPAEAGG